MYRHVSQGLLVGWAISRLQNESLTVKRQKYNYDLLDREACGLRARKLRIDSQFVAYFAVGKRCLQFKKCPQFKASHGLFLH